MAEVSHNVRFGDLIHGKCQCATARAKAFEINELVEGQSPEQQTVTEEAFRGLFSDCPGSREEAAEDKSDGFCKGSGTINACQYPGGKEHLLTNFGEFLTQQALD